MDISSVTIKFAKSFEEWNFSSILGGNDIKLGFHRICNIALPPQSLRDAPPCLSRNFPDITGFWISGNSSSGEMFFIKTKNCPKAPDR